MSVSLTLGLKATAVETLTSNVPAAAANGKAITHSGYNEADAVLTGSTTPPVTTCAHFSKALVAGVATIDLTALTGTNGAAVDMTGLKIQFFKFKNPITNANPITVTFGAANPYLLGGAAWKYILQPGQWIAGFGNDATPDVAAGAKNIDISGTGTQALQVSLDAG